MATACACGSTQTYAACCRPYHRGEAEPQTAVTLMRARFCAYAVGEVEYLWRTLDESHPDRARSAAEHAAQIRAARRTLRYVRLRVLDAAEVFGAGTAQVVFHAEIYEAGKERSFVEASSFRRAAPQGRWGYASGRLAVAKASDSRLSGLTLANFGDRFPDAG